MRLAVVVACLAGSAGAARAQAEQPDAGPGPEVAPAATVAAPAATVAATVTSPSPATTTSASTSTDSGTATGSGSTTATVAAATAAPNAAPEGFRFGSYGRVGVGSDLRGAPATPVNVVAHGSRIVEPTYLELDLYYYLHAKPGLDVATVTTLAFGDSLFHFTGKFDAKLAIRNLYLEAQKALPHGTLGLWAGSRMYRGDDIYLLDYWPLDDVNTIGGGAWYKQGRLDAGVHVGVNRLLDPFQFQDQQVFDPGNGSVTIPELDRERTIATVRASYRIWDDPSGVAAKVKVYADAQRVPAGQRKNPDDTIEALPDDQGFSLGAQLGLWGFAEGASHVNLFTRWSKGLSAFDELTAPTSVARDKKTYPTASEFVLGLSGNLDLARGGVMLGAYARSFRGASPSATVDDGWEYIVDARPRVRLVDALDAAVDLSWQVKFPRGLDPTTLQAMDPAVFQLAPMLVYSPFGPGGYARPQFRLLYRAAHLNEAALDSLYPLDDPRRARTWSYFLGVQAEWWFNSTYR